jgi:hypothetical protein
VVFGGLTFIFSGSVLVSRRRATAALTEPRLSEPGQSQNMPEQIPGILSTP